MQTIVSILPFVQVVLSVLLVITVLLQQTGAGLGGAFGGDNFSAGYNKRRGMEKNLFYATITIGILFVISAFIALLI